MPLTLVPGIDLANHSMKFHNACHRYNHTTSTFTLVATRDVEEQVVFLYWAYLPVSSCSLYPLAVSN